MAMALAIRSSHGTDALAPGSGFRMRNFTDQHGTGRLVHCRSLLHHRHRAGEQWTETPPVRSGRVVFMPSGRLVPPATLSHAKVSQRVRPQTMAALQGSAYMETYATARAPGLARAPGPYPAPGPSPGAAAAPVRCSPARQPLPNGPACPSHKPSPPAPRP